MISTEYSYLIISKVTLLASIQIFQLNSSNRAKKWIKFKANLPWIIRLFPVQRRTELSSIFAWKLRIFVVQIIIFDYFFVWNWIIILLLIQTRRNERTDLLKNVINLSFIESWKEKCRKNYINYINIPV